MKVLDHIIIGNNRYFSFADQGLIEEYELCLKNVRSKI
ncbi:MAG: JAB domain-containing protein [Candidatus Aminicenantaceae bacterium]